MPLFICRNPSDCLSLMHNPVIICIIFLFINIFNLVNLKKSIKEEESTDYGEGETSDVESSLDEGSSMYPDTPKQPTMRPFENEDCDVELIINENDALIVSDMQNCLLPKRRFHKRSSSYLKRDITSTMDSGESSVHHSVPSKEASPSEAMMIKLKNEHIYKRRIDAGSFSIYNAKHIGKTVNDIIRLFEGKGAPIIYTMLWHPPNHCSFHEHMIKEMKAEKKGEKDKSRIAEVETDYNLYLSTATLNRIVKKGFDKDKNEMSAFSGIISRHNPEKNVEEYLKADRLDFKDLEDLKGHDEDEASKLHAHLQENEIRRIFIVGVIGEDSVRKTAEEASSLGYEVYIINDAIGANTRMIKDIYEKWLHYNNDIFGSEPRIVIYKPERSNPSNAHICLANEQKKQEIEKEFKEKSINTLYFE
jgi:nicotinamidase-related amidase